MMLHYYDCRVTEVIGSGHFGEVDKGLWKSVKQNTTLEVALKSLPSSGGSEDKVKLLQEAVIMGQFSHPNVIHLYGIISQGDPVSCSSDLHMYVVIENIFIYISAVGSRY